MGFLVPNHQKHLVESKTICSDDRMLYKIEMHHFNGWGDANWTDTKDDVTTPVRFKSITAAQAALDALFADVREAVVAGDMEIEESPQDYRIVEAHNETRSVLRIDPTW